MTLVTLTWHTTFKQLSHEFSSSQTATTFRPRPRPSTSQHYSKDLVAYTKGSDLTEPTPL